MSIEVESALMEMTSTEEYASRELAFNAAHEIQDEMDALCMQIKQLLVASYAIKTEETAMDSAGRRLL